MSGNTVGCVVMARRRAVQLVCFWWAVRLLFGLQCFHSGHAVYKTSSGHSFGLPFGVEVSLPFVFPPVILRHLKALNLAFSVLLGLLVPFHCSAPCRLAPTCVWFISLRSVFEAALPGRSYSVAQRGATWLVKVRGKEGGRVEGREGWTCREKLALFAEMQGECKGCRMKEYVLLLMNCFAD